MKYPVSFNISKGKPLNPEKRYLLKDLGFEYDVPPYNHTEYDVCREVLEEKIKNRKEFFGFNFEIEYIQTLILSDSSQSAFEATYEKVKQIISRKEAEALLAARCLNELSPDDAGNIIREFEHLILTLLPRDFADLYSYVGMEFRNCYVVFFGIALKNTKMSDVFRVWEKIKEWLIAGKTLYDIYRDTCLTKRDVSEAVSRIVRYERLGVVIRNRLIIEKHLFSTNVLYRKDAVYAGNKVDFAIFDTDEKLVRIIVCDVVTHLYFNRHIHGSKSNFQQLKYRDLKLSEFCTRNNVELIRLENFYFEDGQCKILRYKNCADIIKKNNEYRLMIPKIQRACISNKKEIENSKMCGCLFCENIFPSYRVTEWSKNSAICPICEEVSVIGDAQGFDISPGFFEFCSSDIPFYD